MRAALLLVPVAALAATVVAVAAVGQDDSMDQGNDAPMATGETEMSTDTNLTAEAPPRLAWLSGGMWLIAGEAETGAVWYFEPFDSDFGVRPFRVVLRTDETPDPASPHDNTARVAELDCAGQRYRILATTHYDDAGRASAANERGDGSMAPVVPGSTFAAVAETVCRHAAHHERMRSGDR